MAPVLDHWWKTDETDKSFERPLEIGIQPGSIWNLPFRGGVTRSVIPFPISYLLASTLAVLIDLLPLLFYIPSWDSQTDWCIIDLLESLVLYVNIKSYFAIFCEQRSWRLSVVLAEWHDGIMSVSKSITLEKWFTFIDWYVREWRP